MKPFLKLLAILFIASLLLSCGSRKKQLEKTKIEIETNRKLDSISSSKTFVANEVKQSAFEETIENEETIEYEGQKEDSLKVIKIGADGKIISKTIIIGKGKGILKTKATKSNIKTNKNESSIKIDEQKLSLKKEETKTEISATKKLDVQKSGLTFTTWLWLVLMALVIIAVWYLNYRFQLSTKIKAFFK